MTLVLMMRIFIMRCFFFPIYGKKSALFMRCFYYMYPIYGKKSALFMRYFYYPIYGKKSALFMRCFYYMYPIYGKKSALFMRYYMAGNLRYACVFGKLTIGRECYLDFIS